MIKKGFYVRCPIDWEYPRDPRVFALGKVCDVNEFNETAHIKFLDPFGYRQYFDFVPNEIPEAPLEVLDHCRIFIGSIVQINNRNAEIIEYKGSPTEEFDYYVQYTDTKEISCVKESALKAEFLSGKANPTHQLKRFEFHNPCWYLGRQIVKGTMSVLDNSIFGFKELAGCKIYLKAFQMNTIMQCLQSDVCRYMIADEVGLGKTIEACSILKIYLCNKSSKRVLVAVPEALLAQWKTELLFKFGLYEGTGKNKNTLVIKSVESLKSSDVSSAWDFVIVDEVHNYITNEEAYNIIHSISCNSENIILLSATPIQQRTEEYLKLLQLVLPDKYDSMSHDEFLVLAEKQNKISRLTHTLLDEIDTFKTEVLPEVTCENPHDDEEVSEVLEEIQEYVSSLDSIVLDETLSEMIKGIDYDSEDFGMYAIQVVVSYICDNYQIERNIIRGRRAVLGVYPKVSDGEFAERKLNELTYSFDENQLFYEYEAYRQLTDWILSIQDTLTETIIENTIKPILSAFFSSPWAYDGVLSNISHIKVPDTVLSSAKRWVEDEEDAISRLPDLLDEIETHPSRLAKLVHYIDTELFGKKVVVFTDFEETFQHYYSVLNDSFGEEVTCFSKSIDPDEAEYNIYRFQTEKECKILVCDKSGGEGRNLQIADYVIHVDLPWNIISIEQRIGRLDRMGRNVEIPVTSVVIHTVNTYEDQLFDFWNQGLDVFRQSLSGIEIIMKEINHKIVDALLSDFEYGLHNLVPELINEASTMRETVRKEQLFDTAALRYRPLYIQLNSLLNNYQFNENSLFAETMMSWASLAGFGEIGRSGQGSIVSFSENSFSIKSAQNSYLIPPDWTNYISKKQNEMSIRVLRRAKPNSEDRIIHGTFDRDVAIKNDYIHFYAPGDEIFDCITDNALHSYRGLSTAFAALSSLEWKGFIYTYTVVPDIRLLLDSGISLLSLGLFKQYLGKTVKTVVVPFSQYGNVPEKDVLDEHRRLCKVGYFDDTDRIDHLGRRSYSDGGFLRIQAKYRMSNIEWFKGMYDDKWESLVDKSYAISKKKVKELYVQETNVETAKELIEQILSSSESRSRYYGLDDREFLEKQRKQYELIYQCIEKPVFRVEAACFLWLKNE